jgi:glycosyltransferase involved in cell wall biosynthesis
MDKPKVSIVVAAYNVDKYISRCLESLAKQTLKEIEILVVNDGSKDRTEYISEKFKNKDDRFKVITQENSGLSSARNTGIMHAKARYIAFLDGDDYVKPKMYETLYNKMNKDDVDLVICGFDKVWENEDFIEIKRKTFKVNEKLLKKDIITNFLSKHDEPFVVAWNKLYKKDILVNNCINFQNKAFFEDVGFIARYIFYVKNIQIVNEPFIFYIQRAGSITKSFNPVIFASYKNTTKLVFDFYKDKLNNKDLLESFRLRLLVYLYNYYLSNNKDPIKIMQEIKFKRMYKFPIKHKIYVYLIKFNLSKYIFKMFRG